MHAIGDLSALVVSGRNEKIIALRVWVILKFAQGFIIENTSNLNDYQIAGKCPASTLHTPPPKMYDWHCANVSF